MGSGWERERRSFFEVKGARLEEVGREWEDEEGWLWGPIKKNKERQREEKWEKICVSSFSK